MTKSRTRCTSSTSSSQLGIGTSSNLISKLKPKIRIIHVYAPEVIKTDAANFRELVQRLTGKPEHEEEEEKGGCRRRKRKTPPKRLDPMMIIKEQEQELMVDEQKGLRTKKEGENNDNGKLSSGGGFLEGFSSEFDCFMEEFSTMPVV